MEIICKFLCIGMKYKARRAKSRARAPASAGAHLRPRMPRRCLGSSGGSKRFAQRGVEVSPVIWIPDAHVPPDRGHLAADSARDEACFVAAVDRWKVAVRLAGQNDGLRLDAAERLREVAAIGGRVADVAVHPGP